MTIVLQDIRQETCYDDETDRIFIPFKDSNLLFNDLFQDCVQLVLYRNISENRSYTENQIINEKENFFGPSRIVVSVVYQDKNTDRRSPQPQIEHLELSPEQVHFCSKSDQMSLKSIHLIVSLVVLFIIVIIVSLIVFFIRRKNAKKPKIGVNTNPEYHYYDTYYKNNQETYGGDTIPESYYDTYYNKNQETYGKTVQL